MGLVCVGSSRDQVSTQTCRSDLRNIDILAWEIKPVSTCCFVLLAVSQCLLLFFLKANLAYLRNPLLRLTFKSVSKLHAYAEDCLLVWQPTERWLSSTSGLGVAFIGPERCSETLGEKWRLKGVKPRELLEVPTEREKMREFAGKRGCSPKDPGFTVHPPKGLVVWRGFGDSCAFIHRSQGFNSPTCRCPVAKARSHQPLHGKPTCGAV